VAESFSRACDDGPADLGLLEALEDTCQTPFVDPVDRFLADVVFTAYQPPPGPAGFSSIRLERRSIPALDAYGGYPVRAVGVGGGFLVALVESTEEPAQVLVIEPESGELVREIQVGSGEYSGWDWDWLSSSGDPVLVFSGADAAAWRVALDEGALSPLSLGILEEYEDLQGVADEAQAWALAAPSLDHEHVLREAFRLDLVSGDWGTIELPDELGEATLHGLHLDAGGIALSAQSNLHQRLVMESDGWSRQEMPAVPGGGTEIALEDGRLLIPWSQFTQAVEGWETAGVTLYEPQTGLWSLPDDPCDADRLAPFNYQLSIAGQPWILEYSEPGDGVDVDGFFLTRVWVE